MVGASVLAYRLLKHLPVQAAAVRKQAEPEPAAV